VGLGLMPAGSLSFGMIPAMFAPSAYWYHISAGVMSESISSMIRPLLPMRQYVVTLAPPIDHLIDKAGTTALASFTPGHWPIHHDAALSVVPFAEAADATAWRHDTVAGNGLCLFLNDKFVFSVVGKQHRTISL
jgi:hypothetical protein